MGLEVFSAIPSQTLLNHRLKAIKSLIINLTLPFSSVIHHILYLLAKNPQGFRPLTTSRSPSPSLFRLNFKDLLPLRRRGSRCEIYASFRYFLESSPWTWTPKWLLAYLLLLGYWGSPWVIMLFHQVRFNRRPMKAHCVLWALVFYPCLGLGFSVSQQIPIRSLEPIIYKHDWLYTPDF